MWIDEIPVNFVEVANSRSRRPPRETATPHDFALRISLPGSMIVEDPSIRGNELSRENLLAALRASPPRRLVLALELRRPVRSIGKHLIVGESVDLAAVRAALIDSLER